MANNIGTLIVSPIRPQGETDVFPTVYANETLGGHHQVETDSERNNISSLRLSEGMLVTVLSSATNGNAMTTYQLSGGSWINFLNNVKSNSDIFYWDDILKAYTPYSGQTTNAFDNSNTDPDGLTRLNYNGSLYVTTLNINNSVNDAIKITNNSDLKNGVYIINNSAGTGSYIMNNSYGLGLNIENNSTGYGIYIKNTSNGTPFVVNNSSVNIFTIDYNGNINIPSGSNYMINNIPLATGNTLIPTSNILFWNSAITSYTPYSTSIIGSFDSSNTNPSGSTRLNYNGNLYVNYLNIPNVYDSQNGINVNVNSNGNGININNTLGTGINIASSNNSGININSTGGNGLYINSTGGFGINLNNSTSSSHGIFLSNNHNINSGVYISNNGDGDGLRLVNNGNGRSLYIIHSGNNHAISIRDSGVTLRTIISPNIGNISNNTAYVFDTQENLTGSTKLVSFKIRGIEKAYVDCNSNLKLNSLTGLTENVVSVDTNGILKIFTGTTGGGSNFILSAATNSTLGGVIVSSGLTIDINGNLSLDILKTFQVLIDSTTINWDMNSGYNASVTLGGNRTLSISNVENGDSGMLIVNQDVSGNRVLTFPINSKFLNGVNTLTLTSNAIDIVSFVYDGTNYYWNIGNSYS